MITTLECCEGQISLSCADLCNVAEETENLQSYGDPPHPSSRRKLCLKIYYKLQCIYVGALCKGIGD
jgi:hypothetical protein